MATDLPPAPPPAPTPLYDPLPYESRLTERARERIELVVIHCTETPDLDAARREGERIRYESGTGNSGHYYIDRDGSLHLYVKPERVAHHVRGHNDNSIGIELVNSGRHPDWYAADHQAMDEPYTQAQIATLIALLQVLVEEFPNLRHIAGHEDLDTGWIPASDDPAVAVRRKRDPGPLFPWDRVLQATPLERIAAP